MCESPGNTLEALSRVEATAIEGGRRLLPPIAIDPLEPPLFDPIDLQPRF